MINTPVMEAMKCTEIHLENKYMIHRFNMFYFNIICRYTVNKFVSKYMYATQIIQIPRTLTHKSYTMLNRVLKSGLNCLAP